MLNRKVPNVIFKTRIRDESISGDNPYRWKNMSSDDYFSGKRIILFSLPGAFTPTCSTFQLPDFEKLYPDFTKKGIVEFTVNKGQESYKIKPFTKSNVWGLFQSGKEKFKKGDFIECYTLTGIN